MYAVADAAAVPTAVGTAVVAAAAAAAVAVADDQHDTAPAAVVVAAALAQRTGWHDAPATYSGDEFDTWVVNALLHHLSVCAETALKSGVAGAG